MCGEHQNQRSRQGADNIRRAAFKDIAKRAVESRSMEISLRIRLVIALNDLSQPYP